MGRKGAHSKKGQEIKSKNAQFLRRRFTHTCEYVQERWVRDEFSAFLAANNNTGSSPNAGAPHSGRPIVVSRSNMFPEFPKSKIRFLSYRDATETTRCLRAFPHHWGPVLLRWAFQSRRVIRYIVSLPVPLPLVVIGIFAFSCLKHIVVRSKARTIFLQSMLWSLFDSRYWSLSCPNLLVQLQFLLPGASLKRGRRCLGANSWST